MYSKAEFTADFDYAYCKYPQDQRSSEAISLCYQTYSNSASAQLGALVVGRIVRPPVAGQPPMIGLDDIERLNFGVTNDRNPGSVLWSTHWSPPLNDSWLMGGIHAKLPFYLASPRTQANLQDPTFGLTITGRELVGLMHFGYKLNPNTRLGEVFECKDHAKAAMATFREYDRVFQDAVKKGDWKSLTS